MCAVNDNTYILSAIGARIQLGPKHKGYSNDKPWLTNDLAFDFKGYYDWAKVYWFEQTTNKYGFSLMPNGGKQMDFMEYNPWGKQVPELALTDPLRKEHGYQYEYGGWHLGSEDFYQLFYVAKQAWRTGGMDLHDVITFYPVDSLYEGNQTWNAEPRDQFATSWGTRYGVRMARRLTPEELGYEVYYRPGPLNNPSRAMYYPDMYDEDGIEDVKIGTPREGQLINNGYKPLPPGYLRGFYLQYRHGDYNADAKNGTPKYTVPEIVRMARCVEDEWLIRKLKEKPCNCNQIDMAENIEVRGNNMELKAGAGKTFKVYAKSNMPEKVNIGLFRTKKIVEGGIPGRKNKTSHVLDLSAPKYKISTNVFNNEAETNAFKSHYEYSCVIPASIAQSPQYVLCAYTGDIDKNPEMVKRIDSKPHLVDILPFTIAGTAPDGFAAAPLAVSESNLSAHMRIRMPSNKLLETYKIANNQSISLLLTTAEVPKGEKMALYDYATGQLVQDISAARTAQGYIPATIQLNASQLNRFYIIAPKTSSGSLLHRAWYSDMVDRLVVYVDSSLSPVVAAGFAQGQEPLANGSKERLHTTAGQTFTVSAPIANMSDEVKIGLFDIEKQEEEYYIKPVDELNVARNGYNFTCRVNASVKNGEYFIQPYMGNLKSSWTLIHRDADNNFYVENIPVTVGNPSAKNPLANLKIDWDENLYSSKTANWVKHDETFVLNLPQTVQYDSDVSIGLFHEIGGTFIRDILVADLGNGRYECNVENLWWSDQIEEGFSFILAPYSKSRLAEKQAIIGPYDLDMTKESILSSDHGVFGLDRISLYIEFEDAETRSAVAAPTTFSLQNMEAKDVSMFYNMGNGTLYVKSTQKVSKIEIYSVATGNKVTQRSNTHQIDLSTLASGLYIGKATTADGKVKTMRFIKF